MKKLMVAVASAMAVGLAAQAEEWFNAKIDTYTEWPTNNAAEFKGEWSNQNGATLEDSKLEVSANESTPLTFTATDSKPLANNDVKITSTLTFTMFDELPAVPAEAKAGVIACNDYFYVLAKGDGDENEWTPTNIGFSDAVEVTVTFESDSSVTYKIGEETSTNVTVKAVEAVSKVCMSGDGAIAGLAATYDAKSVGPTPASGSETAVTPVPGEANTYVVAPTGKGTTVAVQGVKSGDTLVVDGGSVDTLGVNSAEGVTVKVKTQEGVYDITAACKGWDGNTFSAELDSEAEVKIGEETIPVTPTTIEATEGTIADGAVATKSIPGLTYKLMRGEELGTYGVEADSELATETTVTLTDGAEKKPVKAFYIIEVTK